MVNKARISYCRTLSLSQAMTLREQWSPMQFVSLREVIPGMMLAAPVLDGGGRVLLRQGVMLTPSYLYRLEKRGFNGVFIRDAWKEEEDPAQPVSAHIRAEAQEVVKHAIADCRSGKRLRLGPLEHSIETILNDITSRRETVFNLIDLRSYDSYLYAHSVNVAIIALLLGLRLGQAPANLIQLGIGALLHDVGKTVVSRRILNKPARLTPSEFQEVQRHPSAGYDILGYSSTARAARVVALEHHERYQGQGYPSGLSGQDISALAHIVAVADVYDALTSERVYRPAVTAQQAWLTVRGMREDAFAPWVIEVFEKVAAPFPPGTKIRLRTGEVGVVARVTEGEMCRAEVLIVREQDGGPVLEERVVDLTEEAERRDDEGDGEPSA